jgi:hypothetical protein
VAEVEDEGAITPQVNVAVTLFTPDKGIWVGLTLQDIPCTGEGI